MKFLVYTPDAVYDDDGLLEREIGGESVDLRVEKWRDQASLNAELLARADGLLVWQMTLDEATIARLQRCKIIVRCGTGYNNIDVAAASARGIPVCNTPDYGTAEVADHTIAMLLALERGLIPFDHGLRTDPKNNFDYRVFMEGRRLAGRLFATVGLGPVGTATALRAKAFNMRVVAFDPYVPRGHELALGVERVESLDELFARADILSLHVPLNKQTANLINAVSIAKMKPHITLLNTGRGGLIEWDALYDGMKSNHVRFAGIDVFPTEPPNPVPRLLQAFSSREAWLNGRLVLTPHVAWSSIESRADVRTISMKTMVGYLLRGQLRSCLNPSAVRQNTPSEEGFRVE
jgi:phosphoglycerate dehydrogenase-like enzyme